MNQVEIDQANLHLVKALLRRLPPGELISAVVTVHENAKGLGFYPALEGHAAEILSLLRQKPDEVFIERRV